jgi:hypothetical protein
MNAGDQVRGSWVTHPSQARAGIQEFPDALYVVTMLENPLRWRARYANYWQFEREVREAGAKLLTVEVAFGDREFEVTKAGDPWNLQLRTRSEIWHKENALNLGMARLPAEARYIAWIDADVKFQRPDWAQETMHLLQHYDFIQMFSFAQNVSSQYEPASEPAPGFLYKWLTTAPLPHLPEHFEEREMVTGYSESGGRAAGGVYGHPGFAWAARRDALEKVGMLIDWAILGSGDYHMATALVNQVDRSLHGKYTDAYRGLCHEWQKRASGHIRQNVGYMPGLCYHSWHGTTKLRHYGNRWKFLWMAGYDPLLDLKKDAHGLYQLTDRSVALRDGIRAYNRLRDEDAP